MEKRVLIAIAVSFAVLGLYPLVLQKFYPDYHAYTKPAVVQKEETPAASPAPSREALGQSLAPKKDIILQNEKVKFLFNENGGAIREISFPEYPDSETKAPIQLFSLADLKEAPTRIRLYDRTSGTPASEAVNYKLELLGTQKIQATSDINGVLVTKTFELDRSQYNGKLKITFQNLTAKEHKLSYDLLVGPSAPSRHSIDGQYIEANFYSVDGDKKKIRHLKESKAGKSVTSAGAVQWVATKDRHFSVIVRPDNSGNFSGLVEGLGNHRFAASLVSPIFSVPASASITHEFTVYAGPNDLEHLLPLGLDPIVNFGKLDIIGKLLVGGLELLHKIVRNYGIAIIVLTILINILLFPLTRVSYMSMKRMQLIQPQMNKLKEQNKNNPQKLNKEMMELYKKHKVNPFGGCLPMILQMPVFIALYVALSKSVILVNSKLFWIQDLSSPDKVNIPFAIPFLGNQIHALPIIMMIAMFLQQKFTMMKIEGQDPAIATQQKMMTVMMPIMFGFIFYTMPSGLVLYWLTNTILMSSYQLYLKRVTL